MAQILSVIITLLANFFSVLAGSSLNASKKSAKSLYDQQKALDGVGSSAKKAEKSLASFDEINKLGNDSGSGSGSAAGGGIEPDFSDVNTDKWLENTLGKAAGWVTAALLLGGIALVAIGAVNGSIGKILAGLLLIGTGIYVGVDTGTFSNWLETILEKAGEWVTAALLLGGIALIAIGASKGSMTAVLAGIALLGAGIFVGAESGALKKWYEALMLPEVSNWVTVALTLGGIALIGFGIGLSNIAMLIAGLTLLDMGIGFGIQSGTLKNWWDVLMLPQVASWVTTALLLGGIGLLVIGIATGNLPMLLAGLVMLGGAITFGITSGTFSTWINDIKNGLSQGWTDIKSWWNTNVAPKFTAEFWQAKFDTIREALVQKIKDGINGAIALMNKFIAWVNEKLNISWDGFSFAGKQIISAGSFQLLTIPPITPLATGGVIPPNKEFLAVLGDQKSGTNIETPLATMVQAFKQAMAESGGGRSMTIILELDNREFGRAVYKANNEETQRVGLKFA